MKHRIIEKLLVSLDAANYHPCGGNWSQLHELVDFSERTYGTLADWTVVLASEWSDSVAEVLGNSECREDIEHCLPRLAMSELGLSESEWEAISHLPVDRLRASLENMLVIQRREVA